MEFIDKLKSRLDLTNSHVCVGLDSRYDKIPLFVKKNKSISDAILEFNKKIIIATSNLAVAYKINIAFYEGFGIEGIKGLVLTTEYLKRYFPKIILLADCKRSKIGEW